MDSPQAVDSNIMPDIVLGAGSAGFVECLVRLQAEAAANNILHDLGGAASSIAESAIEKNFAPVGMAARTANGSDRQGA